VSKHEGWMHYDGGPIARCAGCDLPVAEAGETCSFKCYEYMYAMVGNYQRYYGGLPEGVPLPVDLSDQPWYEAEAAKIERIADEHEVTDPTVHKII